MPAWLSQILVALGGFIGGRAITTVGERMKEGREMRLAVDRLALAMESVPQHITALQQEIHRVGARAEAQMERLTSDLHGHLEQVDRRFGRLDDRIDDVTRRIDGLASAPPPPPRPEGWPVEPRIRLRIDQERRCLHPADGKDEAGSA